MTAMDLGAGVRTLDFDPVSNSKVYRVHFETPEAAAGAVALTGIALLFAMIRINPAPLCLLDEIDAPLDEANVVRFGNYVRKIPDSQFLIITHRKPTMAICPVLFGVTMEEKGVSKLVSVKIEEKE